MKTLSKTILTVLATGVISCGLLTQQAQAISVPLFTDTLYNLSNTPGETLTIGDKVFSGFSFQSNGLTGFDAHNIHVTASFVGGIYFLDYTGGFGILSAGPTGFPLPDLLLKYTVTATAGQIIMIDQQYTGSAQPTGGAFLAIDETVSVGGVIVGNSHLDALDLSDPFAESGDNLNIVPGQTSLNVIKDIGMGITSATGGFVTVSDVQQSFHQTVPDGGSAVALLGIALAGIEGARRIFRARKA